jgi:hypothetical protein
VFILLRIKLGIFPADSSFPRIRIDSKPPTASESIIGNRRDAMLTPPSNAEQTGKEARRDGISSLMNDLIGLVLLAVLSVIVIIAILSLLGPAIGNVFSNIVMGL